MRVGDIITDGSVKWVVRHIAHPVVGTIVDWQSTTNMGDGFLKCTGAGIDPNIYPLLKNILPLVGGKLILPDRRGVVPRGLDEGRGLDIGRALGSYQGDDFKSHNHYGAYGTVSYRALSTNGEFNVRGSYPYNTYTDSVGGAETRMKNVATTFWICYA